MSSGRGGVAVGSTCRGVSGFEVLSLFRALAHDILKGPDKGTSRFLGAEVSVFGILEGAAVQGSKSCIGTFKSRACVRGQ